MKIDREELAWAAGFFEGEGCFTYGRMRSGYIDPRITISQVNLEPLEKFRDIITFGNIKYRTDNRTNGIYHMTITGFEKVQFITALFWNWLSERRRNQAKDVLKAFLSNPQYFSRGVRHKGPEGNCLHGHPWIDNYEVDGYGVHCKTCRKERLARNKLAKDLALKICLGAKSG